MTENNQEKEKTSAEKLAEDYIKLKDFGRKLAIDPARAWHSIKQKDLDYPWMNKIIMRTVFDRRLTKEAMNYLWDDIRIPSEEDLPVLAGNISKSFFIQDKDNWFYDNVLKSFSENMYYRDWDNYYDCNVIQKSPPAEFALDTLWVNYQKQHEFNPPHLHNALYSFVVFMKIPTHWKEQHELPWLKGVMHPCASDFQFLMVEDKKMHIQNIPLSPEDEGRILFFPAWLYHQVFPFYGTEEERITISGNIEKRKEKKK